MLKSSEIFHADLPLKGGRGYIRMADLINFLANNNKIYYPAKIALTRMACHRLYFAKSRSALGSSNNSEQIRDVGSISIRIGDSQSLWSIFEDSSVPSYAIPSTPTEGLFVNIISEITATAEPRAGFTFMDRVVRCAEHLFCSLTRTKVKPIFSGATLYSLPRDDEPLLVSFERSLGHRLFRFLVVTEGSAVMHILFSRPIS